VTTRLDTDDSTVKVAIRPGQAMPALALPDPAGDLVRLKAFRQRRPALIALLHGGACLECRDWLATLARIRAGLVDLQVQTLLVVPERAEQPTTRTSS
jgi:hypothetical protein